MQNELRFLLIGLVFLSSIQEIIVFRILYSICTIRDTKSCDNFSSFLNTSQEVSIILSMLHKRETAAVLISVI